MSTRVYFKYFNNDNNYNHYNNYNKNNILELRCYGDFPFDCGALCTASREQCIATTLGILGTGKSILFLTFFINYLKIFYFKMIYYFKTSDWFVCCYTCSHLDHRHKFTGFVIIGSSWKYSWPKLFPNLSNLSKTKQLNS
jgi:hypothetical protein